MTLRITNRCPKCKGGTFEITTQVAVHTSRTFVDGRQTAGPYECSMHSDLSSHGHCECGHQWRLRDPHLDYIDAARARQEGGA
ncbi:hypothetical protein QRO11_12225 [Paracidovorax citrulli]|uniref:hypothetical protein n=1 Tax=Paracidovorax citrulli TaxID=80869 RepID=UPI000881480B|nr:hypothetical protein [Paracidovorax citrulli]UMT88343.1 hypothetical protein FRC90_09855 [Paracidovorax citrulli]WIY32751.1 hypothetical protein QRO11_12225 [Paracidovorax citrulli]SDJ32763.1 hypothetical protein SAMN04489709_103110 [Paracidovorax citrulli]